MEPSREELLDLLMRGEGMSGGKRRGRKKAVPPGLKKFQTFHKKNPDLTKKQASKAYQAQKKKKKGKGFDENEADYADEFEGLGMLGGEDPSSVSLKSSAWETKNVKEINAYEEIGEAVMKLFKKHFPKKYKKLRKDAVGYGIDQIDYVRFAKADANKTKYGQELREAWNTLFNDVVDGSKTLADLRTAGANYLSPRENLLSAIGAKVINMVASDAIVKVYELDEA